MEQLKETSDLANKFNLLQNSYNSLKEELARKTQIFEEQSQNSERKLTNLTRENIQAKNELSLMKEQHEKSFQKVKHLEEVSLIEVIEFTLIQKRRNCQLLKEKTNSYKLGCKEQKVILIICIIDLFLKYFKHF